MSEPKKHEPRDPLPAPRKRPPNRELMRTPLKEILETATVEHPCRVVIAAQLDETPVVNITVRGIDHGARVMVALERLGLVTREPTEVN